MGQTNRHEHHSGSSLRRVEAERLDSWKEIAAYLHRDARTVRRWEQERNLPVHRVPGGERSGVFAYVSELDRWLRAPEPVTEPVSGTDPDAGSRVASISILRPAGSLEDESGPLSGSVGHHEPEVEKLEVSSIAFGVSSGPRRRESDKWPPKPAPDLAPPSFALPVASTEPGPQTMVATEQTLIAAEIDGPNRKASPLLPEPALWTGSPRAAYGIMVLLGLAVVLGTTFGYIHYRRFHPAGVAHYQPKSEAQDLYLRGRYFWNLRSEDGLNRAVDLFTQSIVTDPHYAAPYAGLADSYLLLRQYGHMPDAEAYPRALTAARQAVSLDPSLPDAHRSLAFVLRFWNWDMASAEREYLRSIELDPRNSQSHHWYATALLSSGRVPEAIAQIDIARALEPQSVSVLADRGLILTFSDAKSGAQVLEQITQTQPDFVSAHTYLARAYLAQGNYAGFLKEAGAAASLKHEAATVEIFAQAQRTLDSSGPAPMLRRLAHDLGERSERGEAPAYFTAQVCGLAGESAQAMHFLQLAHDRRDPGFLQAEQDPAFKSLARSPEFLTLAGETGSQPAGARQPIAHLALPGSN